MTSTLQTRPLRPIGWLVIEALFDDIADAIAREKQRKNFNRDWKIGLIEHDNPERTDLYPGLV